MTLTGEAMQGGRKLLLAGAIAAMAPCPAAGQVQVDLGAALGAGVPVGELRDDYRAGPVGRVFASLFLAGGRVVFVADLGLASFIAHDATPGEPKFDPITMLGSLVLRPVPGGVVHPYLLLGAGLVSGGRPGDGTSGALQGGLGVELGSGRTRVVIDGRLVTGGGDAWVPLTLGIVRSLRR